MTKSMYKLVDNDLILTLNEDVVSGYSSDSTSNIAASIPANAKPKQYVLRLKDLPDDSKPREKLLASGVYALSLQELIAVV